MNFPPLQRRALAAMGYTLVQRRGDVAAAGPALSMLDLPPRLRGGLERWVGAQWAGWPAPEGTPADAAFKRDLWRRVRDWRRGG